MKKTTLQDVLNLIQVMRQSLVQGELRATKQQELDYNLGAMETLEVIEGFIKHGLPTFEEDSE